MEFFNAIQPILVPLLTLILGYFGEKGLRRMNIIKTKTEVESTKISDMDKSLKFWVTASNEMKKELLEMQGKMDGMEDRFEEKIRTITIKKDEVLEERENLKALVLDLRYERDEFKILNDQLRETIERQDAKIVELEKFIQKQNMKISTLESKLQKYNSQNND